MVTYFLTLLKMLKPSYGINKCAVNAHTINTAIDDGCLFIVRDRLPSDQTTLELLFPIGFGLANYLFS